MYTFKVWIIYEPSIPRKEMFTQFFLRQVFFICVKCWNPLSALRLIIWLKDICIRKRILTLEHRDIPHFMRSGQPSSMTSSGQQITQWENMLYSSLIGLPRIQINKSDVKCKNTLSCLDVKQSEPWSSLGSHGCYVFSLVAWQVY